MSRWTFLASAVLLVGCDSAVAPIPLESHTSTAATREGVTRERFVEDFDIVFFSRCNLEDTQLTGTIRFFITTTVDGPFTTIAVHDIEAGMRAVGLATGREYIYNLTAKSTDVINTEEQLLYSFRLDSRQITVIKGEGQFTRIQVIISGHLEGANFVIDEKKLVDECPGAGT